MASAPSVKTMKDLLAKEEFQLPRAGQILTGRVISVSKSNVMLDLGSAGIGIVYPGQFYDNPDRVRALQPGEEVSAVLLELENEDGYRELSLKAAQLTTAWQRIKELRDTSSVLTTIIQNINKGGLIVQVEGVQGFLPLSQLSSEHYPKVEGGDTTKIVQALQKFKGQAFKVKVLDYNEQEGKLIVSERAIQEEAAKGELAKLAVGETVEGTVTEVTDFGAFVRLSENLDGLIHSSEIDWKFVEDPRQILHSGDTVTAKVISLDGGRVALSLKALRPDPWLTVDQTFSVGQKVEGTVIKVRSNGAFVQLNDDIVGLLPTAEFGGRPAADVVTIGTSYPFAIVSIDAKDHKLILTLDQKA
ncbi:MAG: 30S ribosomal protein S1 [Candidatus Yanofskybacteria bacterium]|nr:30S ribosomal protein S1 [Candidatus Yanofskybacteria bacterium]